MTLPVHNKVFFFVLLLISLSVKHLNAQTTPADTLNKVSVDSLNTEAEQDELETQVKYTAQDSIVAVPQQGKVYLYGKSKVNYGSMEMQSEIIEIDYKRNLITAYGKPDSTGNLIGTPVFKEAGQAPMEAEKISYNLKSKRGKIFNALTKQGELLVIGNEIKKDSTDIIYMKDMRCIPCEQKDARTVFKASKAKIIPNDKIVTGPMFVEIGGVPTPLGLPFGYFPNTKKQHNGILIPAPGNSPNYGYFLKQGGYYWGINDKTDLAIRGDIYANGSFALNATNNYKVLYKSTGYTRVGYSLFNNGDKDIPSTFSKLQSYDLRWLHNQDNKSNPTVRFGADVNYVSNQNVSKLNSVNSAQFLQNQFMSNISYAKTFKTSALSLNAQHSQNSQSHEMNIILPSLTYNINSFFPFKNPRHVNQNALDKFRMYYQLSASNHLKGADSTIFKGDWWDNLNYGMEHKLPLSTSFNIFKYITATPALNTSAIMVTKTVRKEFYMNNIGTLDKERDSLVPAVKTIDVKEFSTAFNGSFNTDLKTQIYFDYHFKKGRTKQIRHLLIPTLGYDYRPDYGKDYFGYWKQVQVDTLGNKSYYSIYEKSLYSPPPMGKRNALTLNLNNNLEGKFKQKTDSGTVFKKVVLIQNISINTDYNFAADSFKLNTIKVTGRTKILKYFDVQGGSTFDPYAYDRNQKRRINEFAYNKAQDIARLVDANMTVNTGLGSNMLEALRKTRETPKVANGAERGIENDLRPGDKLAWNLSMYYTLHLTNPDHTKLQPSHSITFSGDVMPTKYWKLGISSGYDFNTQKINYTRLTVYRDLKCWQAHIDWVPFGVSRQYSISINLKTAMLSDFKIPRQRNWFDNF